MSPQKNLLSPAVVLTAAVLFTGSTLFAANDVWIGDTDANFSTLANWTGSVTPNGNTPVFGVAGLAGATLNNDIAGASYAGYTFNADASAYTIGGSAFTLTGNIANGSAATQTFSVGADITTAAARTIQAGAGGTLVFNNNLTQTAGGVSTFNGTGGITLAGTNSFTFGAGDNGLIMDNAGTTTITGTTSTTGAGGTQAGWFRLQGGRTVAISTGGTLNIGAFAGSNASDSIIGINAGSNTMTVAGGALNVSANSGFIVANAAASGSLNVNSGTATFVTGVAGQGSTAYILMGRQGATGTINLNGGVLETGRTFGRNGGDANNNRGTANFNFNGGTLKALANNSDWFNSTTRLNAVNNGTTQNATAVYAMSATTVRAGGAIIDTNGFNAGINTVLAHDATLGATADGGLTKLGAGTLTLGAANTYSGNTTIVSGTLSINTAYLSDAGFVSLATGAVLDLTFVGSDSVAGLFFDGVAQADGTWGAIGSGAAHESGFFTGTGTLNVAAVPEPGTCAFLAVAGLAMGLVAARRRRAAADRL